MTSSHGPTVNQVFELLDHWRHLPFYPLEGRAAPFFALFLRDILRPRFGEMHKVVIPEFPLRIGTLYTKEERESLRLKGSPNQSYNVDYVTIAKDMRSAYLVELKTDLGSKNRKQDKYLSRASEKGLPCLIEGVRKLAKVKRPPAKRRKYGRLLDLLDQLEIEEKRSLEVVFIQPKRDSETEKCEFEYIYFHDVAKTVGDKGDLGRLFAQYVRRWITEAGS